MLTITQNAAQAVETIFASAPEVPDSAGMRISRDTASDGQPAFRLAVVEAPEKSDEVVEAENVSIFIEPGTSELLADKVLDARVEEGRVGFMIGDRA